MSRGLKSLLAWAGFGLIVWGTWLAFPRTHSAELSPGFETVFLAPSKDTAHLSATLVRQIASMGGDVSGFVPACVQRALSERFKS